MNSTDPYIARQEVIEKMMTDELEAQSHNSDICDSESDRSDTSDSEYESSERS